MSAIGNLDPHSFRRHSVTRSGRREKRETKRTESKGGN